MRYRHISDDEILMLLSDLYPSALTKSNIAIVREWLARQPNPPNAAFDEWVELVEGSLKGEDVAS